LTTMIYGGDELALRARIQIPSADWNRAGEATQARRNPDRSGYQGSITVAPGKTARFRETVNEEAGRVWIAVEVTADADLDAAGVYYVIDLPRAEFAGGKATFQTAGGERAVALPYLKPEGREFFRADASVFTAAGTMRGLSFSAALDGARSIALADRWDRAGRSYAVLVRMHEGPLAAGQTASLRIGLALEGRPDRSPARLTVDTSAKRYTLHGFGGNYCFNIESPVTQYTLRNLKVASARTEMSLSYWEPDDHSQAQPEPGYFDRRLEAHPRLRAEMQLSRQIQDLGIPYVISIWAIPEWLYTDPQPQPRRRSGRRVPPEKWTLLARSIGSYLTFAKERFGAEPDLFSFNEANLGIDVALTPEEHRDMIKLLGSTFERLGLKTHLLLGDATGLPQNIHT
jgi:hypothetical protein